MNIFRSWNDHVREGLEAIGPANDWWKKYKNREEWKSVIQVLLDVPSPQDWKICNNEKICNIQDMGGEHK